MGLILNNRPGRWNRYCPTDPAEVFDYCAALNAGDWDFQPWLLSGGGLAGVYLLANPQGQIATIDSHPAGNVYNSSGNQVATLTWNAALGYYEPDVEIAPGDFFFARILSVSVTLHNGDSCSHNFYQLYQNIGDPAPVVETAISLTHTKQTGFTFTIMGSSGFIDWDDGSGDEAYDATVTPDSPSHTYASPGTYTVLIKTGTPTDVEYLTASNQNLTAVDISKCTAMYRLEVDTNSALASITNPTSTTVTWTAYYAYSTALTTWDGSNMTKLGGDFRVYSNTSLTSMTFPTSSEVFSKLWVHSNTSLTSLNVSNLTGLGTSFHAYGNTAMTSVSLPTTSQTWSQFFIYSTGLTSLDLSGLSNLGGDFRAYSNTSLTSVTNPTSSAAFTVYRMYSCTSLTSWNGSGLTGLAGEFKMYSNTSITSMTFPTSSGVFTFFWVYLCSSLGSINVSGLSNLGGNVLLSRNAFTSATFPTSGTTVTQFEIYNNSISGTLDVSGLSFTGRFWAYGNSSMTSITFKTNYTGVINDFDINACGFTSALNLSELEALQGDIRIHDCPSLTSITFHTTLSADIGPIRIYNNNSMTALDISMMTSLKSSVILDDSEALVTITLPSGSAAAGMSAFYLNNNGHGYVDISGLTFKSTAAIRLNDMNYPTGLTTADVNCFLVDLDTALGAGTGQIDIDGSNSAPDASSGGCNGTGAKSQLQTDGWTVNTN